MNTATAPLTTTSASTWSTRNKVGLGLLITYAVTNVPSVFFPAPDGEVGPPLAILVACTLLAVIGTVAGVLAWVRRSRAAARLGAISITLITISGLPALFVDVPAAIQALVAVSVVWTIAAIVLTFTGRRTA